MTVRTKGNRNNKGKPRLSLFPPEALAEVAKVLGEGADIYGVNNWRLGLSYAETMDSVMRHLLDYQKGNRVDPIHGTHHLANAIAGLSFLIAFDQNPARYAQFDDRFKIGEPVVTDDDQTDAAEPAPDDDHHELSEDDVVNAMQAVQAVKLQKEDANGLADRPNTPISVGVEAPGRPQKLARTGMVR